MQRLTSCNCRAEDIGIVPIVVAELKLRDVQRQVFLADLVIAADDAALNQRPKTLDCIGVNRADNVLARLVVNDAVIVAVVQAVVAGIVIRAEQTDAIGNSFVDEFLDRFAVSVGNDAGDYVALAPYRTDDWRFEFIRSAPARAAFLVPMTVLVFAANVGFVHFDDAAELLHILDKRGADFVAHQPSGFVGTEAHVAHDLQSAHAYFAGQHEVNDFEPVAERLVGVLEDRPGNMGEAIAVRRAFLALPVPFAGRQVVDSGIAATRAADAFGPATGDQIAFAGFLVGEHRFELGGAQLMDWLGAAGHRALPRIEGYCHA
jgi:hypothetical protein